MFTRRLQNSTLFQKIGREGGKLHSRLFQSDRAQILKTVQRYRLDHRIRDHEAFGRWCLSIPQVDYARIVSERPDLAAPDFETRQRAWRLFLASDDSAPYRVREQAT